MRQRSTLALLLALAASLLALTGAPPMAAAQSATDKATARGLASEGMRLHDQGRYAEALDRLERAQALFNAPVHLLYIARCQAKVGKLVEAAETYRSLALMQLEPGAPEAFREAVTAAGEELKQVEPRIPRARILVKPEHAEGLRLSVDGAVVPAAAIGVERPMNPGSHTVVVSANGYAEQQRQVDLADADRRDVFFELQAGAGAPSTAGAGAAPTAAAGPAADTAAAASSRTAPEPGSFGFVLGLRLAGLLPMGKLGDFTAPNGANLGQAMGDRFKLGMGLEVRAGLRFARYFSGFLLFDGAALRTGRAFDDDVPRKLTVTSSASLGAVGLGAAFTFPRNRLGTADGLGYFGELGLLFSHDLGWTQSFADKVCTVEGKLGGSGLRLGGGMILPISDMIQLTPFASLTLARATTLEITESGYECGSIGRPPNMRPQPAFDIPASGRQLYEVITIGIGGDLLLGADRP